jgi:hypothetical protein
VMLIPPLARILKEHRIASRFTEPDDPVFASRAGTPIAWRNAARHGSGTTRD